MHGTKIYLETQDFLVSQEHFKLLEDKELEMLITFPTPNNLYEYYETESYISHQDKQKTTIDKIYHFVKSYTLHKKVRLIEHYSQGHKTLLDIGTGTGAFLQKAQSKGWFVTGVEPNPNARNKAIHKNLIVTESITKLTHKNFQIITLWHVLEHLPDLEQSIGQITKLLPTNGTLFIAVPNFKSHDAQYYGKYWAAYDTPRHLWHFSQKAITKLFKKEGLYVFETIPMYFDSFYVSLLSEKYKTGKANYLKAFYRGLTSNLKATRTGEYSSLLYVLKKTNTGSKGLPKRL